MNKTIIKTLIENGFEAYYVGGCVRDELLGLSINDYDITTNASPDEIEALFKGHSVDAVGKTFGVMIVDGVEVATYRTEKYDGPSKPTVSLARTFYEDASRRDFTINAMAKTIDGEIIDYFGGQEDLRRKLIRAVGNPTTRFKEDPSRILRAMYLAARLGFQIEKSTFESIRQNVDLLRLVPHELTGKILMKVLKHRCLHQFMVLLRETHTLKYVFPELHHTIDMPQNPKYHNADVYGHILRVVKSAESKHPGDIVMAMAAVFHDCAKGLPGIRGTNKEGQPNDIGHEEAGAPIAQRVLIRLQFGKEIAKQVAFIVRFHGIRLEESPKSSTVKRVLKRMVPYFKDKKELIEGVIQLFDFMNCDAEGFAPSFGTEQKRINGSVRKHMMEVLDSTIFYRSELPITGRDLIEMGFQGKQVGEILDYLVQENLQTKETIINRVMKKFA